MVASGMGAERGILIRSGEALQTLRGVRMVVFDKTGTLTKGKPEVTHIVPADGVDRREVLRLAASAERGSEHPLGRAVVARAEAEGVSLSSPVGFQARRGLGIAATVDGQRILVGSTRLMEEGGIDLRPMADTIARLEEEAQTVVVVAANGRPLGVLGIADTLKEDAAATVEELRRMGIRTAMITGDSWPTARAIARKAGIDHVLAEVLPDGKVAGVRQWQEECGTVAFVGDGINDAPALRQANVGIALGTGTDIAIEAGDIVLVRGDLMGVVRAVRLSRAAFRKIQQNLFWAFFYNVVMIPLAVMGWMHPVLAEAAMATSSVTVVTNANLLRRAKV